MEHASAAVGVDFGTTNSSIAVAFPDGRVDLTGFEFLGQRTDASRSLLYFESAAASGARDVQCWTGPCGIEHYLAAENKGRLIQSLKSFLSSRNLTSTNVLGRQRSLEELIARILADLRREASTQFGIDIRHATVGRPVRFVGADTEEDSAFAERRLEQAFLTAGFERVTFVFEPLAAGYHYQSTLDHDELILIGDFGGGTSDFSLVRVGPGRRGRGGPSARLLGTAGVGVAGDAFDAKIVRHLVSPALGAGTTLRSMDKTLPVPAWPYLNLERWHHLSLMKTGEVLAMLDRIAGQALEPARLDALIHLVRNDLGYQLHRAVQAVKSELSKVDVAEFSFSDGDLRLWSRVDRRTFEGWITDELQQIEACVDGLLAEAGIRAADVDAVFLTGGSSFVPAVRRIFDLRVGRAKIRSGHEFTSVARGLAVLGSSASSADARHLVRT